ncbi:formate transporter FocA [Photobacterium rosenbergii]|uniref:Formate transporter FocA n=1 Tax=Photobacterium rosenbergii TaxID=294936 RepID=A0ABU3ZBE6_9GAMM|nr:formate transporter FocA [Photobacterium rosenbergii]MDV5167442.1 formate transporter FocA [Photobacterium rosenbergii]
MSYGDTSNNQLFSPMEMMAEAEKFALSKAKKTSSMTLGLAMMAGAFIGLAFVFYITVTTGSASAGWGLSRLVGGMVFSMGLILIVLCGGELFTSSVLSSISWANRQITLKKMLSLWGKVYIGNFFGAMFMLMLITGGGLFLLNHGQWGLNALNIAQHKLHHTPIQAFTLGVLCNLLVCLAIWMTFSSANALTKAVLMILPVSMFVSSGFEHSVANMFMVPLGIVIQHFAPEQFWQMVGADPQQYSDLNINNFLFANLIPVTLGNIVGGAVLVGLANWCIFRRPQLKATNVTSISQSVELSIAKEVDMLSHVTVKDLVDLHPLTLSADLSVPKAVDLMTDQQLSGAPVCDVNGHLIGFLSMFDVMKELWYKDYQPAKETKVVDLMSSDVVAVDINDRLVDLIEYLCIDKDLLYPSSDMGIATSVTSLSLEERVKALKASKPRVLPVLQDGQFVGVITRDGLMAELRKVYHDVALAEVKKLEIA